MAGSVRRRHVWDRGTKHEDPSRRGHRPSDPRRPWTTEHSSASSHYRRRRSVHDARRGSARTARRRPARPHDLTEWTPTPPWGPAADASLRVARHRDRSAVARGILMPCRSQVLAPHYPGDDRPPAHHACNLLRTVSRAGRGLKALARTRQDYRDNLGAEDRMARGVPSLGDWCSRFGLGRFRRSLRPPCAGPSGHKHLGQGLLGGERGIRTPGDLAAQRFSRPTQSSTLPSLRRRE